MEWLFVVGILLILWWFHVEFGQYIVDPGKRTRDHVAGCAECHERILQVTMPADGERLCPVGRVLLKRYGAW